MLKKLYKNKTISYKLRISKDNKSPAITMEELDNVLRKTKNGKTRDPEGLAREIFRPNIIGDDLKVSLVTLLNVIKEEGIIPQFMRRATISTIPKKNKSRLHLKNERGIFLVNIIRGIFMRVLYNIKL